jgi:CSLREA domain-containing protein
LLLAAAVALLLAPAALAAPPNDGFADREVIPALNFYDTVADIETATVDASDPPFFCRSGPISPGGNTIWYSYTTPAETQYVNLLATGLDTMLAVYEAGTPSAATMAFGGCNDDFVVQNSHAGIYGMRLRPNTTYTIELATWEPVTSGSVELIFEHAHVWQVNKTVDTDDGICDDTDCSLRDAIESANQTGSVVLVPAGTYRLLGSGDDDNATGDLDLRRGFPIYGAGPGQTIIEAEGNDRVLDVDPGARGRMSVMVGDLTIRGGTVHGPGGGLRLGSNDVFLDMANVVVERSSASEGGGLRIAGRGRLLRSRVTGNRATSTAGGISLGGDDDTLFEVRDSVIDGNRSDDMAGGVFSSSATTFVNSTIHGNEAALDAGGLLLAGRPTLRSVTVSGNHADGLVGGVMFGLVDATVVNSVIADNTATPGTFQDCAKPVSLGTITSSSSHLEDPAGSCPFNGPGDVTGSDPGLRTLADNGGPLPTVHLARSSPLIDSGDACSDAFDQRGFPRTVDGDDDGVARCDKGAFEYAHRAPVCAATELTVKEDEPATPASPCSHPDLAPITYAMTAQRGTVVEGVYRPNANYVGPDTIAYTADDGIKQASGVVHVTVTPVDDAAVAVADSFATAAGVPLSVPAPGVLANDSDVEGDALSAAVASAPAGGTLTLGAAGGFTYTPAAGFSGIDSFTYVARDSAPATVTITVAASAVLPAPNARPVVSSLAAAQRGRSVRFTLSEPARVTVKLLRSRRAVKTLRMNGRTGRNTLALGRLKRGRYKVEVTAVDPAGLRSAAARRTLTLGR